MKKLSAMLALQVLLTLVLISTAEGFYFNDGETHIINDDTYKDSFIEIDFDYDYENNVWFERGHFDNISTHVDIVTGGSGRSVNLYHNSGLSINGGSVHGNITPYNNAKVSMSSGYIGGYLSLMDETRVHMSGGSIGGKLQAGYESIVSMSGGSIGTHLIACDDTIVTMSGGSVAGLLKVQEDGIMYLSGSDFQVNGIPLVNGDKLTDYGTLETHPDMSWHVYLTGIITGTLDDGSALNNEFRISNRGADEGTADIIIIPEPCSIALLGLGVLILRKRNN